MKYGISTSKALGKNRTASDYVRLAQAAEDLGFISFWTGDHVSMPLTFDVSRYPAGKFDEDAYWPDPFVFLAAIGAVTKHIRLGTGIAVVPYRPPLPQAQAIATLDYMSDGRFVYGAGIGWMEEEFATLGIPFRERGARADEYLTIMKALWSGDSGPFEGRFYSHAGTKLKPLPVQKPHPRILIGGYGIQAFRRAARFGDGLQGLYKSPDAFREDLALIKPLLVEHGRDFDSMYIMMATDNIDHILDHPDEIAELEGLSVKEIMLVPEFASIEDAVEGLKNLSRKLIG